MTRLTKTHEKKKPNDDDEDNIKY